MKNEEMTLNIVDEFKFAERIFTAKDMNECWQNKAGQQLNQDFKTRLIQITAASACLTY